MPKLTFIGTRYHLREQALANLRPETKEELFNLRHSSLRNAIERIFGVLKRRFQCLNKAMEYSFETQQHLVFACTALHNFIRSYEPNDHFELLEALAEEQRTDRQGEIDDGAEELEASINNCSKLMDLFRDKIADAMWEQYQRFLQQKG
jgi:hypothetical protein